MNRIVGENGEGVFYQCDVCERTYKDKTKMKHHIETHLNSYQICPICQQHCKTRRTLKTHMARTHSSNFDPNFDLLPENIVRKQQIAEMSGIASMSGIAISHQ